MGVVFAEILKVGTPTSLSSPFGAKGVTLSSERDGILAENYPARLAVLLAEATWRSPLSNQEYQAQQDWEYCPGARAHYLDVLLNPRKAGVAPPPWGRCLG